MSRRLVALALLLWLHCLEQSASRPDDWYRFVRALASSAIANADLRISLSSSGEDAAGAAAQSHAFLREDGRQIVFLWTRASSTVVEIVDYAIDGGITGRRAFDDEALRRIELRAETCGCSRSFREKVVSGSLRARAPDGHRAARPCCERRRAFKDIDRDGVVPHRTGLRRAPCGSVAIGPERTHSGTLEVGDVGRIDLEVQGVARQDAEKDPSMIQADAAEHRARHHVAQLLELIEDERSEPVAYLQAHCPRLGGSPPARRGLFSAGNNAAFHDRNKCSPARSASGIVLRMTEECYGAG
jgi:hypothetical protein